MYTETLGEVQASVSGEVTWVNNVHRAATVDTGNGDVYVEYKDCPTKLVSMDTGRLITATGMMYALVEYDRSYELHLKADTIIKEYT